jgi:hypothetical protein
VIATLVFSFLLIVLIVADLRAWLQATSDQLERAEHLLYLIDDNTYSTAIRTYFDKKSSLEERVYIHNQQAVYRHTVLSDKVTTPTTTRMLSLRLFSAQNSVTSIMPLSPTVENLDDNEDVEQGGVVGESSSSLRVKPPPRRQFSLQGAMSEYRVNEQQERSTRMLQQQQEEMLSTRILVQLSSDKDRMHVQDA